ncbi:MAG: hypothetical protein FJ290_05945 [Planctomycetes bacterium]|nr:hypothetical protein [Planctomycetota bacterium]
MRAPALASFAAMALAAGPLLAAEPLDVRALPPNEWVERPTSGLKGQPVTNAGGLAQGLACVPGVGLVACGFLGGPPPVWRLDLATGEWAEFAPPEPGKGGEPGYNWSPLRTFQAPDGREVPLNADFHGMQVCHDAARNVLVGFARGVTIEFDMAAKKWAVVRTEPTPPGVTAGSLCSDPVNREVVLATGGYSFVGGTDGTWLYDGARKQWRRLDGPKPVEEARLPLAQARDRLVALRWLLWKNLEFRSTGREALLDARSKADALGAAAREVLAALAPLPAAKAERPYDTDRLARAAALRDAAAARLAGLDAKVKAATPEELEALYRQSVVPALEDVEQALAELAVTPEGRMSARLVYDPRSKLIVCFGGDGLRCAWGDTWVYHCEGRWWERRRPTPHPAPSPAQAIACDPATGATLLLRHSQAGGRPVREMWLYDAGADRWRLAALPPPADAFWLEYDPAAGVFVALNQHLTRTMLLRLDPATLRLAEAKEAPEAAWLPTDGPYVLRDAAPVAELRKWTEETQAWAKGVPPNTWVAVPQHGTGRPHWGRSWSGIVCDPSRLQIYYRDGGHGSYHGAVTDHYDLATGRWFRSDRRDEPAWPMGSYFCWGRSFALAPWALHTYKYNLFYHPLRQRLWRRASGQADTAAAVPADQSAWVEYDPDTGLWERELALLPSLKDSQWLVPGAPDRLVNVSPCMRYNPKPTTSVWQQTRDGEQTWPSTGPLPYQFDWDGGMCWMYDAKRTRVLFYGGPKGKAGLFALDLAAERPQWKQLQVSVAEGDPPLPGRENVYIPKHDVFLMIECMPLAYKGEPRVWALDAASHTFRRVALAVAEGGPPQFGGVSCGLQYDPASDLAYYISIGQNYRIHWCAFRYAPAAGRAATHDQGDRP